MPEQQDTEINESKAFSANHEADLEQIVNTRISDVAWTKSVLFKMAEKKEKYSKIIDAAIILVTAVLTVSLIIERLSLPIYTILAVSASILSLIDITSDWERDYYQSLIAAESYNSLLKKFEEYHAFTLKDGNIDIEKKKRRLQDLTDQHRQLNETTPETDDDIYEELIEKDIDIPGDETYNHFQNATE